MKADLGARLPEVVSCAVRAAEAIRACGTRKQLVHYKKDSTPLTRADLAAHQRVLDGLRSIRPDWPILSEEGRIPSRAVRQKWSRYWLVDPLDGTKEYLAGRKGYTVNIALIERNEPVLGVIAAPATRDVYYAARGLGSWHQKESGKPSRLFLKEGQNTAGSKTRLRVLVSRSHLGARMDVFKKRFPSVRWLSVGSSIKFAWVAAGKADWYVRLTPTMEWDVAAGDCILAEARGGPPTSKVRRENSPLLYNKRSLRNPGFIVGANVRGELFKSAKQGAARLERLIECSAPGGPSRSFRG